MSSRPESRDFNPEDSTRAGPSAKANGATSVVPSISPASDRKGEKMYEITQEQCRVIGGGNQSNGGASQTIQTCTTLPNGGAQCTSSNGHSMVVTTYDRNGNLTSTMACTTNRSFSAEGGVRKSGLQGNATAGGGSTCTRTESGPGASPASSGSRTNGVLAIEIPYGA